MARRKPNTFLIIGALWTIVFMVSCQIIIVAPILPEIGRVLAVGEFRLGLVGTAYAVTLTLFALITGPISDRVGRRKILLYGSGFLSLAMLLHWFADNYAMLLTVRAVAGAAGGVLSGSIIAYVGDYFPYERRGWAAGWVMSGVAAGQILGIPLGTLLAYESDFRLPFIVFGVVMSVGWLLTWFFVPQPHVERSTESLAVRNVLGNYLGLMRVRATSGSVCLYFLMFSSVGLFVFFLPIWLSESHGVSGVGLAGLFVLVGLANVIGGPTGGRVSDRIGRKPVIVTTCVLLCVLFGLTTYVITGFATACIFLAIAMLLASLRMSPLQALMTAIVGEDRRGTLMSLAIAVGQLGFGAGTAVAGMLYTRFGYISNTLASAVATVLVALVVWLMLPEPGRDIAKPVTAR